MVFLRSAVTCCALFWLLHRAWLALWKPVPELISVLGIEIPDAPEVSLADIKSDNVTLSWNRPSSNKPISKYLIQVNGVTVGESSRGETIITVTGLKPGHFYNIRVIAVGTNDFQAPSQVIRLSTYDQTGRPLIANGRIPPSFQTDDGTSGGGDDALARNQRAGIEPAHISEELAAPREHAHPGQRRNTLGRRHSPSVTNDPPPLPINSKEPEESLKDLGEKFEAIRKETEEVVKQVTRDVEEFQVQMAELCRERDEKKQVLKEKEEASERLRKETQQAERLNRQAQTRKSQKEKLLKDKHAEKTKMKEDIARWERDLASMKKEQERWKKEEEKATEKANQKMAELRQVLRKRQNSLTGLEEEIRVKGLQIKELEEERKNQAGPDDDETKANDAAERAEDLQWEAKERDLITRVQSMTLAVRQTEMEIARAQSYLMSLNSRSANAPIMFHGNSSGLDLDPTGQSQIKSRRSRQGKSRANTTSSNSFDQPFSNTSPYPALTTTAASSGFQSSLYGFNDSSLPAPMADPDTKNLIGGAPLSPTTATLYLPSGIFADEEPSSLGSRSLGQPALTGALPSYDAEYQQSPGSSSPSASLSSPQASSYNLMLPGNRDSLGPDGDRRSMASIPAAHDFGAIGSPKHSVAAPTPSRRLGDIFGFPKNRGRSATEDVEGPALGSLKPGQSQSFPRQDELDAMPPKPRRMSFGTNWNVSSFLGRSSATPSDVGETGKSPINRGAARRRRGFNMFGSNEESNSVFPERDPGSPRPSSIASSDLPRPSTDSAPFGWSIADNTLNKSSPLGNNWMSNVRNPWSRSASRRPSIQHGSTTALATGVATEDDEILPAETLKQRTPPPVGVIGIGRPLSSHVGEQSTSNFGAIGTRPMSQKSNAQDAAAAAAAAAAAKLNPAAPTFKAMLGITKSEKKKGKEIPESPEDSFKYSFDDQSPVSRRSRDALSIRTQESIADSHESLDQIVSNTVSEATSQSVGSYKEKENAFRAILRKGSTSKFSLSSMRGVDGLFKKSGNGGDRIASGERSGSFGDDSAESPDPSLLGRSVDSITSNPSSSGRMSVNWGRFGKKKGHKAGRDSTDMSRTSEEVFPEDDDA